MRKFWYYGASSAGGGALLLDTYPAIVAYSLRKLRTAYSGSAIRVRRSSNNAEQDIGFSGNDLDTASLLSFVGSGSGFITKFYNQGYDGSLADTVITSSSSQYQIVNNGVLELVNGKPSARSISSIPYTMPSRRIDVIKTVFGVNKINVYNVVNYLFYNESALAQVGGMFQGGSAVLGIGAYNNSFSKSIPTKDFNQQLSYLNLREGNIYLSKNGNAESNEGSFSPSLSLRTAFGRSNPSAAFAGSAQELIFFTTDESANKTAIETDINNYYGIY
jgi:hypothetical protein